MASKKQILSEAEKKAAMLDDLLDKFDELIKDKSKKLTAEMIKTFMDELSVENGIILTDEQNMRKTALIDKAWTEFQTTYGRDIITEFITGMQDINAANHTYYTTLSSVKITKSDITGIINQRLGINEDGTLRKNGYMNNLLDDVTVRNEIKKLTFQKMISGTGYEDLRTSLKELIEGTPEKLGTFEKFHRNFAYDTYVQVDRLNGTLYAERLNLKYFIFQGTRRKASRYFCVHRKGKVFTTDEAKQWHKLIGKKEEVDGKSVLIGPIPIDPASYNPLIELGGIGCVDTCAYISEEIAFSMRPDLRNKK